MLLAGYFPVFGSALGMKDREPGKIGLHWAERLTNRPAYAITFDYKHIRGGVYRKTSEEIHTFSPSTYIF